MHLPMAAMMGGGIPPVNTGGQACRDGNTKAQTHYMVGTPKQPDCKIVITTDGCTANIEMDAACNTNIGKEFTSVTTVIFCYC